MHGEERMRERERASERGWMRGAKEQVYSKTEKINNQNDKNSEEKWVKRVGAEW